MLKSWGVVMNAQPSIERVRYRFIGHVQHRGFRFACVMAAERAQATGWVRNERDGTVTAEAQGTKEAQLVFVRRLTEIVPGYGNDWSVGHERYVTPLEDETGFSVRRY